MKKKNKLAVENWPTGETVVTVKRSKAKLQAEQNCSDRASLISFSSEALETQHKAYGLS